MEDIQNIKKKITCNPLNYTIDDINLDRNVCNYKKILGDLF